jgi:putative endonuclease
MSRASGRNAEEIAASYLQKMGLKILERNVGFPFGEIDLIAQDQKVLVFVEVKHRQSLSYQDPWSAVDRAKRKRIILAAKAYLERRALRDPICRFDVIAMWGKLDSVELDHIKDAFIDEGY